MPTALRQQKYPFGSLRTDPHWSVQELVYYPNFRPAKKLIDESLYQYNGIITGPTWTAQGLNFANDTDTVNLGTDVLPDVATREEFSIIMNVKFDSLGVRGMLVSRSAIQRPYYIRVNEDSKIRFGLRTSVITSILDTPDPVTVGIWYQIVVTYTTATKTIYINGRFSISIAGPGGTLDRRSGEETRIGQDVGGSLLSFKGTMANLLFYNRALSASEILELYINPDLPMQQPLVPLFKAPAVVGANPKGPLGHPLYGPFAGPIVC